MAIQNQNQFNSNPNRIYRDQLLTVEDLNQFRAQLLNDIRNLLRYKSAASGFFAAWGKIKTSDNSRRWREQNVSAHDHCVH